MEKIENRNFDHKPSGSHEIVIKAVKKNVEVLGISLKKFINTVRECHGLTHNTGMEEDIENNQIDDGFPFSAFFSLNYLSLLISLPLQIVCLTW